MMEPLQLSFIALLDYLNRAILVTSYDLFFVLTSGEIGLKFSSKHEQGAGVKCFL
jgi:hypothetical protein